MLQAVTLVWYQDERISGNCQKLLESMPKRIKSAIAAKGGYFVLNDITKSTVFFFRKEGILLMSDGVTEQVKKFVFTSRVNRSGANDVDSLEILIPEQLQASYSSYTWPSSPVLAWFLWENRFELPGKHILELGAGTALPGILAAKCGASVTLTESSTLPKSLQHVKRCCEVNGLHSNQVRVVGLTWGLFLTSSFNLGPVDLIIGSDCFYEPSVFEDIIVTVAFLLESNPHARFLSTYQERSADWSIEHLLHKWNLRCEHIPLNSLGAESGININELMQDHTIHLLEITRC